MRCGRNKKTRLILALARLHSLRLTLASGLIPPLPVPERFVQAFNEAVGEFAKPGTQEHEALQVGEQQLLSIRVGRRGALRAPVYARFVDWPTFVTKLHAALFYCEVVWSELGEKNCEHAVIGFNRGGTELSKAATRIQRDRQADAENADPSGYAEAERAAGETSWEPRAASPPQESLRGSGADADRGGAGDAGEPGVDGDLLGPGVPGGVDDAVAVGRANGDCASTAAMSSAP